MRSALAMAGLAAALLAQPACAQTPDGVDTKHGRVTVETVATGLVHPWGLAFLPDGRALVTERPGRLRILGTDGRLSPPVAGTPEVFAVRQGGLLDVALAPDFETSRLVYLSFAEPGPGGASTAVARGRLAGERLEGAEVVFRQLPKLEGPNHWGSRLAFARDGTLFVTTGDRFKFDPAQDLSTHVGKVLRVNPDGSVPQDNPFVGREGARPEIWSYGHRNVQGAAIHPATGKLWIHEMGPQGGDELNVAEAGRNYGWPLVSWGRHYGGGAIPKPPTRPDLAGSVHYWDPVIAPSGMAFYTAAMFPEWRGDLLIGGLQSRGIVRLTLADETVTGEERIALGARIRDVRQAPDGSVWALTDAADGKVLRLARPGG